MKSGNSWQQAEVKGKSAKNTALADIAYKAGVGFGQKPSCGKSKILLGIGVFLGLRLVESALTSVALFGANRIFPDTWKAFLHENGLLSAQLVLLTIILYHVLLGVIYYVVTHRMLSRHLNLE